MRKSSALEKMFQLSNKRENHYSMIKRDKMANTELTEDFY
jgi:hypothetical protein